MENNTNKIVTLGDGKEYAIYRHVLYQGRTFYLAFELTENKEELKEDLVILEQLVYDGKDSIKIVRDANIVKTILENIELPE